MIALIFLQKPTTIIGSILLLATGANLFPAWAGPASVIPAEEMGPLETPTGSIEDLRGLEERRDLRWLWGVGGEYESPATTSESAFPYQVAPNSKPKPEADGAEEIQLDWQNSNRGEPKSSGATFPVMEF